MKDEEANQGPASPLPVSRGPNNEKYSFSSSSSLSPSDSPPGIVYLLHAYKSPVSKSVSAPSSFSVDRITPAEDPGYETSSCLKELLEWFLMKCCICCCWWNHNSSSKLHQI
ncbi:hypothetical protein RND81_04G117100 [Saponaria officinalis]|uniref:Uncharacterized protein n=1 Tax=Saponaria officinalis TaxID=3572 RepID=A0AAW1LK86_SAPOF